MEKAYDPKLIEQPVYERWERDGCFAPSGTGDPYCIMIPPPNVTGTLHMGHAFQLTVMDMLIRHARMSGKNTLWQPGMDHAGIATQMVVERQLNAQGIDRRELGREEFVKRVWQWKEESGGKICEQQRRIGASVDWERSRFTMDEGLSDAVRKVFIDLYDQDLIYRGKRLVNWDPVLLTALSDLEVLSEEESGHLWHFRYPLKDPKDGDPAHLIVATTRPETMLGDTAVAVHPDDERFAHLVGRHIVLPLVNREIPIVADSYVDPEFGSGCVKITPAHDHNDYEIGQRHNLPMINILTDDAHLNDSVPAAYAGLTREEARKTVVADMDAAGLLDHVDEHKLMVPRGDRSNAVVEPYLTDQWYVNIKPLAEPAIEAVKDGRVSFVPENWSKTYYEWMNNIQDWCISRQLWWGHRIPAWYDDQGNVYVGDSEDDVRAKHSLGADVALRQDDDVLDTWFSSALWPFSTLDWPEQTPELATFYPTSVLVTGFDIIFFWVARMMMMGMKFADDIPFHEIYIHGLVRDENGQKMSKAKGNILDPLDIIDGIDLETLVAKRTASMMQPHLKKKTEKATRKQFPDGIPAFGTDAMRFTFASLATTGRDIRFDLGRVEGYRNFCNKIWNAARYVLMNCADEPIRDTVEPTVADRWIRSRLGAAIDEVERSFKTYRFDLASRAIYEFIWHEYCDWYLELTKPILRAGGDDAHAARRTLLEVLEAVMRLAHPVMPFLTDDIWRRAQAKLGGAEDATIIAEPFPAAADFTADAAADEAITWIKGFVLGLRQIRGEMDIAPSKPLTVLLMNAGEQDLRLLEQHGTLVRELARLESVEVLDSDDAPPSATALLGDMQILVPMAGLIDPVAEAARLSKQIEKQRKELAKARGKLSNEKFVQNAPAAILEKEQLRAAEFEAALTQLNERLDKVRAMST
ncbi:MAG: valine--tRNA ligase [Gammaproteobacteria bacterium]